MKKFLKNWIAEFRSGRITRRSYWSAYIVYLLLSRLVWFAFDCLNWNGGILTVCELLMLPVLVYAGICRCRDAGVSVRLYITLTAVDFVLTAIAAFSFLMSAVSGISLIGGVDNPQAEATSMLFLFVAAAFLIASVPVKLVTLWLRLKKSAMPELPEEETTDGEAR